MRRYDIDAIHFDDYFYPYRIAGKEFPDDISYRKYGNGINREDWRRANVDSIIVMLGKAIKEKKKYCNSGSAPSPSGAIRTRIRKEAIHMPDRQTMIMCMLILSCG